MKIIINIKITNMADINLVVGAGNKFAPLNLIDNVNNSSISATFSNQAVSNSNPEFATIEVHPSNSDLISAVGIAAGTGTVVISVHADYVDAGDGLSHSEDFAITKSFEVTAAPHGAHLDVTFS